MGCLSFRKGGGAKSDRGEAILGRATLAWEGGDKPPESKEKKRRGDSTHLGEGGGILGFGFVFGGEGGENILIFEKKRENIGFETFFPLGKERGGGKKKKGEKGGGKSYGNFFGKVLGKKSITG